MRFGRAKHGIHTMSVTDSQRRIADLEKTLDAGIQKHTEAGGAAGNATAPTTMTRMRHPRGRVRYRSPSGREYSNTHLNSSLGDFDLIGG